MELDSILIDLGTIKQLQPGDKLGVQTLLGKRDQLLIFPTSKLQPLHRWRTGNCRDTTLQYLWGLVERITKTCALLMQFQSSTIKNTRQILVQAVQQGSSGICTLTTTYELDSKMVSELSLITQKLTQCVDELGDDRAERGTKSSAAKNQ